MAFKTFFDAVVAFFTLILRNVTLTAVICSILSGGILFFVTGYRFDFVMGLSCFSALILTLWSMRKTYNVSPQTFFSPMGDLTLEQRFVLYWVVFGLTFTMTGVHLNTDADFSAAFVDYLWAFHIAVFLMSCLLYL